MDKLYNYGNNVYGFVGETCEVGDKVIIGRNKKNEPIFKQVAEIIEQRPEKGIYKDEKKRKTFFKLVLN